MRSFFLVVAAPALAMACGGIAVIDVDPVGEGGGGSTSTSMSDGGGGGTSGGNIQTITLDEALAFVDCFPGGGDGELGMTFTMSFQNVAGTAANVRIPEARLQGMAGQTVFSVSPSEFQVAGNATRTIEITKSGSGSGTPGCDWCTPTDTNLEVELLIDGVPRTFTDSIDSVSCSF